VPVGGAPLAVIAVTGVFALDPDGERTTESPATGSPAVPDGGQSTNGDSDGQDNGTEGSTTADVDRAPWL
jgi:hypothetical protein